MFSPPQQILDFSLILICHQSSIDLYSETCFITDPISISKVFHSFIFLRGKWNLYRKSKRTFRLMFKKRIKIQRIFQEFCNSTKKFSIDPLNCFSRIEEEKRNFSHRFYSSLSKHVYFSSLYSCSSCLFIQHKIEMYFYSDLIRNLYILCFANEL